MSGKGPSRQENRLIKARNLVLVSFGPTITGRMTEQLYFAASDGAPFGFAGNDAELWRIEYTVPSRPR